MSHPDPAIAARLAARLALRGITMHARHAGGYILAYARGGLTREVCDLDAAERLLRQIEGPA